MDFALARFNMIEQQIRPWEVLDQRVLDLLAQIRREEFVPPDYRALACADVRIPLGLGEEMMEPKVEARLLQALDLQAGESVLEVGTGSGFFTALLAAMVGERGHVYSVDIHAQFTAQAAARLAAQGIRNVTLETGDAAAGWPAHGPYEAIAITGAMPSLPASFIDALVPGGRLVVVLGSAPAMEALLITRSTGGETRETLFETVSTPLVNTVRPRFIF